MFTMYGLFSVYVNLPNKSAQSHLKRTACSINILKYLWFLTLIAILSCKNAVYVYCITASRRIEPPMDWANNLSTALERDSVGFSKAVWIKGNLRTTSCIVAGVSHCSKTSAESFVWFCCALVHLCGMIFYSKNAMLWKCFADS